MQPYLRANKLEWTDLALAVGYEKGSVQKAWKRGRVSFDMADAILCKVWGASAWHNDPELYALYQEAKLGGPGTVPKFPDRRRCGTKGCSIYFKPNMPWQLYCSKACKARAWRQRKVKPKRYGSRYDTCPHGHDRSPENLRMRADGSYACRACNREKMHDKYWDDPIFRERRKRDERQRRRRRELLVQAA